MEDEKLWERLLKEQSTLFRRTTQKNAELEARVVNLERELEVWKYAFANNDGEKAELKKQITRLERNLGSLKNNNPLILFLIDGDGYIFSKDLITKGRYGGKNAAQLLTKGVIDHLAQMEEYKNETPSSITERVHIWLSVYYNKSGLQNTLSKFQLCTTEQFEAFIMGFSQASPLFSFIDVGISKEGADNKIKECLRLFTRFPQTSRVFFCGGHDNGYASVLNSLNNEGLLSKVILVRGYNDIAFEVRTLPLPVMDFPGVFMTERLPFNHQAKWNGSQILTDEEPRTSRSPASSLTSSPLPSSKSTPKTRNLSSPRSNYDPPPCNFYYLAECKAGTTCRYGHDYDLNQDDLDVLRVNAKKSPCGLLKNNRPCQFGERCPLGHVCPGGLSCKFYKAGRCKFSGNGMHEANGSLAVPKRAIDDFLGNEAQSLTPFPLGASLNEMLIRDAVDKFGYAK